jgi:acyl-CoA dehydrogenase
MLTLLWIIAVFVCFLGLAYVSAGGIAWAVALAAALAVAWASTLLPGPLWLILTGAFVVLAPVMLIPGLRRTLVSDAALKAFRKILPSMSQTEQEAIDAGTVWWDGQLFSGKPEWSQLLSYPAPQLSAEEQRFLDVETEELCRMVSDWETTSVYQDLPPEVWQFIKDKGFLGMIIPKRYGGLGFSAYAHSQVIQKLSTRCSAVAVTVMVPNSLGPGELLMHYGTEEQKNHYLPRLAKGQEIPCFALTAPSAGSDAASIPDTGIVCRGEYQGKEVLGLKLTWEKRYITLGPVATLLGLAFRVYDPDRLLGSKEDLGITCALIPTSHPGVNIGRRHNPLSAVFQNGPNWGKDVFIPLDWIIGGRAQVGQGWKMLMNCLAAGRAISLPSSNVGMSKLAVRATGAYARIRTQFKTSIGRFEGVEEALTRMGGNLYMADATRRLTAAAVDLGEKPAVVSAIAKYHITERNRVVVNDAMDILGGKGICLGPNNFMGRAYQQVPVSITVEGANILTRSLIIFGQGAIRCHPWVLKEIDAAREADPRKASLDFDDAFFGHIRFTLQNLARSLVMGFTGSHFVRVPANVAPESRRYVQQLTRFSAALAFLADVSMLAMGGALKRREKLSARLGDILSMLYLCSATIKRFEDEGRQAADRPLLHWSIWDAMFKAQNAFEGIISNYPSRILAALLRLIVFPLGRPYVVPSDRLGHEVAALLISPSASRDRLTAGAYVTRSEADPLGVLELGLDARVESEAIYETKIKPALKAGTLSGASIPELAQAALARSVITAEEHAVFVRAKRFADEAIRVDHFPQDLGLSAMRSAQDELERAAA